MTGRAGYVSGAVGTYPGLCLKRLKVRRKACEPIARGKRRAAPRPFSLRGQRSWPTPALLLCTLLLAGCAGSHGTNAYLTTREVSVTQAQACAIGYDLARQVHDLVSLRQTVLLAPRRATPCERHALTYLARAGFRIDTTGQGGTAFGVSLTRRDADTVSAVVRIGSGLRIARSYQPVATGVRAAGPPAIQHMNPDQYAQRPSGKGSPP